MNGDTVENAHAARLTQPVNKKTRVERPFGSWWQAICGSHQDLEAQDSRGSSRKRIQANGDKHSSPTIPLSFTEGFENRIEEMVGHNARRRFPLEPGEQEDQYQQEERQKWIEETVEELKGKFTRQPHPGLQSASSPPMLEGSITYLAKTPANAPEDEDDVLCLAHEFRLEHPTEIRKHLDEAQTRWDSFLQSKFDDSSRPFAVRWIHLPANNEAWVKSVMSSVMTTCQIARDNSRPKPADVDRMAERVFEHAVWRNQRRERQDNPFFSRTMEPFAAYIDGRSKASRTRSPEASINVLAAYMPYLHWESSIAAAYMRHIIRDAKKKGRDPNSESTSRGSRAIEASPDRSMCQDEVLLREYLNGDGPVMHLRRTLDQFYYPTMPDTEERDMDQVIERYAVDGHFDEHTDFSSEPPILMVDQCWVWAIGRDTVLTAFPRTWGNHSGYEDPIDLRTTILKNICGEPRHYRYLKSSCRFARFVIRVSSINLLQPSKQVREHHKFLLYFDHAIGILREKKIRNYKWLLQVLLPQSNVGEDSDAISDAMSDVRAEYEMLEEAQDILEELQMIQELIYLQNETLRQFEQAQRKFLRNTDGLQDDWSLQEKPGAIFDRPGTKARAANVDRLIRKAQKLNKDIHGHLRLKQQQASIMEAHYTRELTQQGARQSNSVMLFTVVTIIFLPLSTIAAVFGINSEDFGSGSMDLGTIFAILFPISAVCVVLSLVIGFWQDISSYLSRFLPAHFKDNDRYPIVPDDSRGLTPGYSTPGPSTRTTRESSNVSTRVYSDHQRPSTRHFRRGTTFGTSTKRLRTSRSTSEQAIFIPLRDRDRLKSNRRQDLLRKRKLHKAGMAKVPQEGDDAAMYSFSSGCDLSNNNYDSKSGDDEQTASDDSQQSDRPLSHGARRRGKRAM